MLKKIIKIKNVGLLRDAKWTATEFAQATLIYAENGRGKSTLAKILYCSSIGSNDITKTIDSSDSPEVELLFDDNKVVKLSNSEWADIYPNIVVFDEHFIDKNIYSGMTVEGKHRTGLFEFILGEKAVEIKIKINELTDEISILTKEIKNIEEKLKYLHKDVPLSNFIKLPNIQNVDDEIASHHTLIELANKIEKLKNLSIPKLLGIINIIDLDNFFLILKKDIVVIEKSAEQQVLSHVCLYQPKDIKGWLSQGQQFTIEEDCPFCGQSLKGVALISAYKSYFNKEYLQLKNEVNTLLSQSEKELDVSIIDTFFKDVEHNKNIADTWSVHINKEWNFDVNRNEIEASLCSIKELLLPLINKKKCQPLDIIVFTDEKEKSQFLLDKIYSTAIDYNKSIKSFIDDIDNFKSSLDDINIIESNRNIKELELCKLRHDSDVEKLIISLEEKKKLKNKNTKYKDEEKDKLNIELGSILQKYSDRINELIGKFGGNFTISEFKHDYMSAGNPRSNYKITLNGKSIKLDKAFSTALSAGDKRTLAFSFFVAHLEDDSDISEKIIVVDDPICSLDRGRRNHTKRILCDISKKSKQIIIMGHDPYFLRDIHDDLVDKKKYNIETLIIRLNRINNKYSDFSRIEDINHECKS
ncbi:MAG: AAA family ATPase [Methylococcales bacterium]